MVLVESHSLRQSVGPRCFRPSQPPRRIMSCHDAATNLTSMTYPEGPSTGHIYDVLNPGCPIFTRQTATSLTWRLPAPNLYQRTSGDKGKTGGENPHNNEELFVPLGARPQGGHMLSNKVFGHRNWTCYIQQETIWVYSHKVALAISLISYRLDNLEAVSLRL